VLLPLFRFVTRTMVSNGRVRCAAVSLYMSYTSPSDECRPLNGLPYHDAFPSSIKPTGAGAGGVLPRLGAAATGLLGIAVSFFAASAVDSGISTGCVGAGGRLADARRDEQPVISKLNPLVTASSTTVRRKFFTASVLARCFARSPGSPASSLLPRACLKLPARTVRSVFPFPALLLLPGICAAVPILRRAAAQFLRIYPWVPCARLCSAIPVL